MRKKKNLNNKGFTLVELIVVLVILAILAAILVPTLLGYIDRARAEKDYATAQAVRVAVQSEIAELYARGDDSVSSDDIIGKEAVEAAIFKLVGATKSGSDYKLDGQVLKIASVTITDNQIMEIKVSIDDKEYTYSSTTNNWTGETAA